MHDLLELAKALAADAPTAHQPSTTLRKGSDPLPARGGGGLAVLTCSGGDSALGADEWARLGIELPALAPATAERLPELLPDAATVGNPLDDTALIWGDVELLRDIIVTVGEDPAVGRIPVFYDQAADVGAAERSWAAVREGICLGAAGSPARVLLSSTLPVIHEDGAIAVDAVAVASQP